MSHWAELFILFFHLFLHLLADFESYCGSSGLLSMSGLDHTTLAFIAACAAMRAL
jgi:hypothetical protein